MKLPKSAQFRGAVTRIKKIPDVVAVAYGDRLRDGAWVPERCLVALVRDKRPLSQVVETARVPRKVDGYKTDVIAIGTPRCCVGDMLEASDIVHASKQRRSTATAFTFRSDGTAIGLLSGHGALPINGSKLFKSLKNANTPYKVQSDGFTGYVTDGACGGSDGDWAVARFPGIQEQQLYRHHYAVAGKSPFAIKRTIAKPGLEVAHYSGLSNRGMQVGRARHLVDSIPLKLPTGKKRAFSDILTVESGAEPFALKGDSGSLVVAWKQNNRVIGTVVGTSGDGRLAFVLRIGALVNAMGHHAKSFFNV